jgi:hypothetical protein
MNCPTVCAGAVQLSSRDVTEDEVLSSEGGNYDDTNLIPENVKLNIDYGIDETGTYTLSLTAPTTPSIRILNNLDGTATATISGSDIGTTNTVWIFLRHGGVLELINAGSRTGDGVVSITKPEGEYIGYVISTLDDVNSLPSDPDGFWITGDLQYLIRTAASEAELQICRLSQHGIQVVFQNGSSAPNYSLWATIESGGETLQLRDSVKTNMEEIVFHIPRQTGFPPERFAPGATITLQNELRKYEIDTVEPSNGIVERSSSFRITCGAYRWESEVEGYDEVVTDEGDDLIAKGTVEY